MIEQFLQNQLAPAAARQRKLMMARWSCALLAAGVLLGFIFWLLGFNSQANGLLLFVLIFGSLLVLTLRINRWRPDLKKLARDIEAQNPELQALLLTAVEQKASEDGKVSFLQKRLLTQTAAAIEKSSGFGKISSRELGWYRFGQFALLGLFALTLYQFHSKAGMDNRVAVIGSAVQVFPGDASIEKGMPFIVTAKFSGKVPHEARMVVLSGETNKAVELNRSLSDPIFGGSLEGVTADFAYFVEYGELRTRPYKVKVFEYPKLERANATIEYPQYTGLDKKEIKETRRVSGVEGSKLELDLQLNKKVARAALKSKKERIPLIVSTNSASAQLAGFTLSSNAVYELELADSDGRTNRIGAQFVIDVAKNRAPEFKIAAPKGDQRVSPIEEVVFSAETSDDFGLSQFGLGYSVSGKEPVLVQIGNKAASNEKKKLDFLLDLERLRVAPEQLISYFFWAEDLDSEGQLRRTSSDIYFAEVRPLEEIFREGQGGGGEQEQEGGEQGESPGEKLAELQKQIISATWNIQNKIALDKKWGSAAKNDLKVVKTSQEEALQQVAELKERVKDPRLEVLANGVERDMRKAVEELASNSKTLQPALSAEQAAYDGLLKFQSREHQVMRQQNSSSRRQGQQANQRQLQELDLKQNENKYERERQARKPQTVAQREQMQVASRLQELAKRQQDFNKQLKELQTALQEAKTEAEKEEIRRKLKRLREEQQEILQDADELRQRMERQQNKGEMAQEARELEKARAELQKASEALEQQELAEAVNSGTRAERDLEKLKEDFRNKNANQFAEQTKELRSQARELAEKQEEIAKQMAELRESKKLSTGEEQKALANELNRQQKALTNVLSQARELTEKSEATEPLLSRQLYDTLRRTAQANPEEQLEISAEMLRQSFVPQAEMLEKEASKAIAGFKDGIERAAESVLGSEEEALKFADQQLENLTRDLEKEIAQHTPGENNPLEPRPSQKSEQPKGEQQREGQQPGNQGEQGKEPGEQKGQQGKEGQQRGNPSQPGKQNQGPKSQQPGQGNSPGEQQQQNGRGQGNRSEIAQNNQQQRGGNREGRRGGADFLQEQEGSGPAGFEGPLTGGGYAEWSDRMREVEETLEEDLRDEVARIRERAREFRSDLKRHSKQPQWDLVKAQVATPLAEVRSRVQEALRKKQNPESLLPLDRDPVPPAFSEVVRKYYEKLGSQ